MDDPDAVGPYRIVKRIGGGGMGAVYEALDTRKDRRVALKVLSLPALGDVELEQRFRQECKLAASIEHPHVLPVYDYAVDDRPYIAMRLIEGTDLASVIKEENRLPPSRAVVIIGQVASALDAAHQKGLYHRDVKPSNILLEECAGSDHAWLFDWGIAQPIDTSAAPPVTRAGHIVGTLEYVAPERLMKNVEIDHRADVYSLSVTLYECLAGARPFVGDVYQVLSAHVRHDPSPLPERVPADLRAVVAKGLAKQPDDRYQSAGELAAAARKSLDTVIERETRVQLNMSKLSLPTQEAGIAPADPPQPAVAQGTTRSVLAWLSTLTTAIIGGSSAGLLIAVVLLLTGLIDLAMLAFVGPMLMLAGACLAIGGWGWGAHQKPDQSSETRPGSTES